MQFKHDVIYQNEVDNVRAMTDDERKEELELLLSKYRKLRESAVYIFSSIKEDFINIGDGIIIRVDRSSNLISSNSIMFDISWEVQRGEYVIDDPYKIKQYPSTYAPVFLIPIMKIYYMPIKMQMKKYILKKINELQGYIEAERVIHEEVRTRW